MDNGASSIVGSSAPGIIESEKAALADLDRFDKENSNTSYRSDGLVLRSQLLSQRAPGSKPDSTEDWFVCLAYCGSVYCVRGLGSC
ncbi:hypothetical protein AVEN_36600-1 [Araneus ventricosus]|uniref:Uncharacterized protein n=1 Tax=Araneus ventricosus TaxID=182803 RepID=A0A4Y2PMX2_ARAVE|nr:hypothetical protein AVEN_36600-1 [Araneus ventricosus]